MYKPAAHGYKHPMLLEDKKVTDAVGKLRHVLFENQDEIGSVGHSARDVIEQLTCYGIKAWEPEFEDELEEMEEAIIESRSEKTNRIFYRVECGDELFVIRCNARHELLGTLEKARQHAMNGVAEFFSDQADTICFPFRVAQAVN
jgi:hypothetical protein